MLLVPESGSWQHRRNWHYSRSIDSFCFSRDVLPPMADGPGNFVAFPPVLGLLRKRVKTEEARTQGGHMRGRSGKRVSITPYISVVVIVSTETADW